MNAPSPADDAGKTPAPAGAQALRATVGSSGAAAAYPPSDDPAFFAGYEAGAQPPGPNNFPPGGPELKRVSMVVAWRGDGGAA